MQAVDSQHLRQAALALHALTADNRGRVWARLDADKRAALEPLLTELHDLGIPSGQAWVGVSPQAAEEREIKTPPTLDKLVRDARRLRADAVLRVLSSQSLDTVACLLAWSTWPWRDAVLGNWSPESRRLLSQRFQERLQDAPASSPFVMTTLLHALLNEVRALPSAQATQPERQGHWINRLFQR